MAYPNIDPVFLKIGPLALRWYGLMYALSFILAYRFIPFVAARKQAMATSSNDCFRRMKVSEENVSDLLFYGALGVVLGGRFGYILFYNPLFYFSNPTRIFHVWEGGMSFHGGLIGVIIAGTLFCRNKKVQFYPWADISMMSVAIGLGLGRLGNFINGELFGRATDLPWCMVFPGGGDVCRHPSQLYQAALEGGAIFLILWILSNKKVAAGTLFWTMIGLYGLFRFLVEFVREPDAHIGFLFQYFSMGQLLSLPMLVIGSVMVWWINKPRANPS
ncbi:MAG: prolipoprotein diacylglyceryl transferase [Nitrospirota bacterium]